MLIRDINKKLRKSGYIKDSYLRWYKKGRTATIFYVHGIAGYNVEINGKYYIGIDQKGRWIRLFTYQKD